MKEQRIKAMHYTPKPFFMETLEVSGSWYDMGQAQGRAMRTLVHQTVHNYLHFKQFHAGQSGLRALPELMRRIAPLMEKHFPEEWAELHGLADGAEIDLGWLVAANFTEALDIIRGAQHPVKPPESQCGGLMFPRSDAGPLIGGTLDCMSNRFWVTFRPSGGLAFQCIMFPGWVAGSWGGVNAAGLALCGASASIRRPENQYADRRITGFDVLPACNFVLLRSCRTVAETLERLKAPDLRPAANLAMLDKSGRGVLVQGYLKKPPQLRISEMSPDLGLCWGNFYPWDIDPETCAEQDALEGKVPFDAFSRYASLKKAVDRRDHYTLDAMQKVLTSHEGAPGKPHSYSICNDSTDVALIAAPQAGKIWLASQPPCVQGFRELRM